MATPTPQSSPTSTTPAARGTVDNFFGWFANGWTPIAEKGRGPLMQLMLLSLWFGVLYLVWLRLTYGAQEWEKSRPIVYVLVGACALPKLLCFCVALIVTRAMRKRMFDLDRGVRPGLSAPASAGAVLTELDALETSAVVRAQQTWKFEMDQLEKMQDRMFHHAGLYGFISSVALSACVLMMGPELLGGVGNDHYRHIAAAIAAATIVSFAKDFGRMAMRAAGRDLSAQMMAWSTKRLLVVVVAATLAELIPAQQHLSAGSGTLTAIAIGAAVAFLGDRAVEAISDRAATALGITPLKAANAFGLQQIDGVDEEVVLRFAEESIDSVHALAFYPTPRLYFSTKFSIQRICDWQDQALLIARVGPVRAQTFRDQFGAKGIVAAREIARALTSNAAPLDLEDVRKVMGLATPVQANFFLRDLAFDELAAALAVYRRATPNEPI